MAKTPVATALYPEPPPPRRKRRALLAIVVALPLLAPIGVDAVAVCYGRWRELLGSPIAVQTPTFDRIGERAAEVREDFRYHVSSHFQRVPWDPRVVLPAAVVVMLLAMVMLRHGSGSTGP